MLTAPTRFKAASTKLRTFCHRAFSIPAEAGEKPSSCRRILFGSAGKSPKDRPKALAIVLNADLISARRLGVNSWSPSMVFRTSARVVIDLDTVTSPGFRETDKVDLSTFVRT
jgi:hypothetical protein